MNKGLLVDIGGTNMRYAIASNDQEDISKINKPIVWRLSDMWPFIGVEHFTDNKKWKKKKIKRHKF